jgi:hypothetical protein
MPNSPSKAGATSGHGSVLAKLTARHRSRTTNNPLAVRASHRTAQGRRIRDLYQSYLRAMGNPTEAHLQADALTAAELRVAAENERAKVLAGHGSADDLVRVENLADRAVRKLGLKPGQAAPRLSYVERLMQKKEPAQNG